MTNETMTITSLCCSGNSVPVAQPRAAPSLFVGEGQCEGEIPPHKGVYFPRAQVLTAGVFLLLLGVSALLAYANNSSADSGVTPKNASSLRRPSGLALTRNGQHLYVANQRSGTISIVDTSSLKILEEQPAGKSLAALALAEHDTKLLTIDRTANELIVFRCTDSGLDSPQRLRVSASPISVAINDDGGTASIASLWTHQLTFVTVGDKPAIQRVIDLPFAPLAQVFVTPTKVLVTSAFGGQLAVVDSKTGTVDSVRSIPAHNIRSLTLDADKKRIWLTDQMLNAQGHAQLDDIRWGNLLTNNIRALRLDKVLDPKTDILAGSDLIHLGELDHGTADPAGVVVYSDKLAVSLAGVGEVALGTDAGERWNYIGAGKRPTAMLASPDRQRLFIADPGQDAILVLNTEKPAVQATVSLGTRPELSSIDRGEDLFYDARLSHQGWLSCHSCHTDGHTSGKLADTLSDGTFGTPKRVLTLLGVKDTGPWAWNGSMKSLEQQVEKSISSTMQGKAFTAQQVHDLTAYIMTLSPPPTVHQAKSSASAIAKGKQVFERNNCSRCHTPPLYTSAPIHDVGLRDETGAHTFNPPSLRGVSQAGPYFHDGRAKTLTDVFKQQRHQLKSELSAEELADLVAFLRSL